jgi:uncharacterized phage infection (PIP) family protein YhgE
MTARQDNKLSMYLAVQKVLAQHASIWNAIPVAKVLEADFSKCITEIQTTVRRQEQLLTGVARDKTGLRLAMAEKAHTLAQAMVAYADMNNKMELAARMNRSLSEFAHSRDTRSKELAEQVLQDLRNELNNLSDYGVKQQDLDQLDALIGAYAEKIGAPRAAVTGRREATQTLAQCFDDTDKLLKNRLDKVMLQLRDKPFYKVYKNARTMVNNRGRGGSGGNNYNPEPPAEKE